MKVLLFLFIIYSSSIGYTQTTSKQVSFYFDFGSWTLSESEQQKLNQFLSNNSSDLIILSLEAHTDTVGSEQFNKELALKRCDTIKEALHHEILNENIIFGKSVALKSTNYSPNEFRKVTVHYTFKEPPVEIIKTEKIIEKVEQIKPPKPIDTLSKMASSIDSFLNDSLSQTFNYDLSILFEGGTDNILKESAEELIELLTILKEKSSLRIIIHGHVCCGSDQTLSENRARAVFNFLVSNQIDRSRLKYIGHSNTQPKYPEEKTEFQRQQNRRVSIEFLK